MGATIFIVDSSPAVRRMVEQISAPAGYEVIGFQDGPTALDAARKMSPALIIADYHLDNITFSGFCKEIGKQDNLAETMIVSIVDASDRLDESKLRALGVRSFLKKPFQSEQLLEAIQGVLDRSGKKSDNGKSAKKRTWPPVSTATDSDEDVDVMPEAQGGEDEPAVDEKEKEPTAMTPATSHATAPSSSPAGPAPMGFGGEEMMKGLFDHLLQSVMGQADRKIADLLPPAIAKEVAGQVRIAVQEEVAKHITESLAPERLRAVMRELIQEELNRQSSAHVAGLESTVRQTVSDLAPPLVEKAVDKQLRELADSGVKKHLPDAVREQLGAVDLLVKSEVQQVASTCARQAADEIVREMAKEPIQQAVQRIVPDVAETQVREEIKRLSSAD